MQEDRIWLQQLQRGEPEGLRRIYERYKDDLVTIAAGLLVDRASAEDCLHDVFVHLAGSPAGILPAARLQTALRGPRRPASSVRKASWPRQRRPI